MEPVDRRIQKLDETLKAAAFGLIFSLIAGAANAESITCTPALPFFCANVHVGCAGKTRLPTHGFRVAGAKVVFDGAASWAVTAAFTESGTVYRRKGSRDWIRVAPDGRFSQRVYLERGPVMTYGVCE